ncbi:hypothetical protein B0H13DRAFT_2556641 [Mycena leptocephala]|nr:hypothetical protein B0H13DRAFT_2556641 [Mycena leptocephala]
MYQTTYSARLMRSYRHHFLVSSSPIDLLVCTALTIAEKPHGSRWSPLSADSTALRSSYHRFSRPTPPALLNVTHIVSEEQAASRNRTWAVAFTAPAAQRSLLLRNSLPNIDGSTMTLAHWLQHFDTRVYARCFWAREWDACYSYITLIWAERIRLRPLRVYSSLKIHFISPPSSARGCRPAGTAHLDPNRDEAPYESANACAGIWLLVLRRSILTVPRAISTPTSTTIPGKCTLTCTPPRGERLPVKLLQESLCRLVAARDAVLPGTDEVPCAMLSRAAYMVTVGRICGAGDEMLVDSGQRVKGLDSCMFILINGIFNFGICTTHHWRLHLPLHPPYNNSMNNKILAADGNCTAHLSGHEIRPSHEFSAGHGPHLKQ